MGRVNAAVGVVLTVVLVPVVWVVWLVVTATRTAWELVDR